MNSESEYSLTDEAVKTTFHAPSGILLTPLAGGKTSVQIVVHVDPQIALVPNWLIDFAVRNLGYLIVIAIRRAVEIVKEDPEYNVRMTDSKNEFYMHIRQRITNALPDEIKYIPKLRK